jgi:hypothetical protein
LFCWHCYCFCYYCFIKVIYNYILETNHVSRACNVAAILLLQYSAYAMLFYMTNVLYFYISTFRSLCAVPNMAVLCSCLMPCFPGKLLRFFLHD